MNVIKQLFLVVSLFMCIISCKEEVKKLVVIDVAHGGMDIGVERDGLKEKDIILNIAKIIKEERKGSDVEIVLSRTEDVFLDVSDRLHLIDSLQADVVISLHLGASKDTSVRGCRIMFTEENRHRKTSKELGEKIRKCCLNDSISVLEGNISLLKKVDAPAIIFELGYLTNKEDRTLLRNSEWQKKVAKQISKVLD